MLKTVEVQFNLAKSCEIKGILLCYLRSDHEYQIPHSHPTSKKEFPGPHYEVKVTSLLEPLLGENVSQEFHHIAERNSVDGDGKNYLHGLVEGRHISIGNDLNPYLCCPNLPEASLLIVIELWLIHQIVFDATKLNLNSFESYVFHENPNFEDWLANGYSMNDISDDYRLLLRSHRTSFEKVREIYLASLGDDKKFSVEKLVQALKKTFNIKLVVNSL